MVDAFRTDALPSDPGAFETFLGSARFDEIVSGRRGAVLLRREEQGAVPIVRTTTQYREPSQLFGPIHSRLAKEICRVAVLSRAFNNALIEHYLPAYAKMKQHSDQALDLADGSSIAVFSCYRDPAKPSRRLLVKPKGSESPCVEVPLPHCSVVTFSLDTNRRFTHAIVLADNAPANEWLGITFRTSKTLVRFVDGHPCFLDGAPLKLADDEQRREFFQLRRRENHEIDFVYPTIRYTISESDMLLPVPSR